MNSPAKNSWNEGRLVVGQRGFILVFIIGIVVVVDGDGVGSECDVVEHAVEIVGLVGMSYLTLVLLLECGIGFEVEVEISSGEIEVSLEGGVEGVGWN